jgi:Fe-S cluster assembly iron-binding protein IscA
MLELTATAATTLASVRSRSGRPDHFGVRIFQSVTPDAQAAVQFDFVEGPQPGDQVGEAEATPFYVAPEVAQRLDNAVLDAEDTPEGTQLILKPRV